VGPEYFKRLKDFVRQAGRRGVVVELDLFCPFYEDAMWNASPMNADNNVNNIGRIARTEAYNLKHPDLQAVQDAVVRKIVGELKEFDNLYYEICNEPYFGGVTWNGSGTFQVLSPRLRRECLSGISFLRT